MTRIAAGLRPDLPALPSDVWEPTKTTLHLWVQIVGKVKLATTAPRNHWWNVPLYLDVRGLTTRRLHLAQVSFQIDFDFVDHRLLVRTNRGQHGSFLLHDGLSVAGFDRQLHRLLDQLGVDVPIREDPYGVPITTPFPNDTEHAAYDPDSVLRTGRSWTGSTRCSKSSPVGTAASRARSTCSGTPWTWPSPASPAAEPHLALAPTPSPVRPTLTRSSRSDSGPAMTTPTVRPSTPTPLPSRLV